MRAKVGARLTVTKATSTGLIVPIGADCGKTVVADTTPDDNTDNTYTITDFSTERMFNYVLYISNGALTLSKTDTDIETDKLNKMAYIVLDEGVHTTLRPYQ